jgi:hypothetical protein
MPWNSLCVSELIGPNRVKHFLNVKKPKFLMLRIVMVIKAAAGRAESSDGSVPEEMPV